jgi:hypothetical protein
MFYGHQKMDWVLNFSPHSTALFLRIGSFESGFFAWLGTLKRVKYHTFEKELASQNYKASKQVVSRQVEVS